MRTRLHRWRMRTHLHRLHDSELSPARARSLQAHLARCPRCAEELARLARADRLLAEARPLHHPLPPAEARVLFQEALESSGVLRRRPRRSLIWALPALGAIAVAAVAGARIAMPLLGRHSSTELVQVAVTPSIEPRVDFQPAEQVKQGDVKPVALRKRGSRASRRLAHKTHHRGSRRMYARRLRRIHRAHRRRFEPEPEPMVQVETPLVQQAPGYLMVLVTTPEPPPTQPVVTVRKMDESAPGYARASAFHPNFFGGGMLTEFTIASNALGKLP